MATGTASTGGAGSAAHRCRGGGRPASSGTASVTHAQVQGASSGRCSGAPVPSRAGVDPRSGRLATAGAATQSVSSVRTSAGGSSRGALRRPSARSSACRAASLRTGRPAPPGHRRELGGRHRPRRARDGHGHQRHDYTRRARAVSRSPDRAASPAASMRPGTARIVIAGGWPDSHLRSLSTADDDRDRAPHDEHRCRAAHERRRASSSGPPPSPPTRATRPSPSRSERDRAEVPRVLAAHPRREPHLRAVWSEAATDPIVSRDVQVVQGSGITLRPSRPTARSAAFRADGGTADTFVFVKHSVVFTSGDEDSRIVRVAGPRAMTSGDELRSAIVVVDRYRRARPGGPAQAGRDDVPRRAATSPIAERALASPPSSARSVRGAVAERGETPQVRAIWAADPTPSAPSQSHRRRTRDEQRSDHRPPRPAAARRIQRAGFFLGAGATWWGPRARGAAAASTRARRRAVLIESVEGTRQPPRACGTCVAHPRARHRAHPFTFPSWPASIRRSRTRSSARSSLGSEDRARPRAVHRRQDRLQHDWDRARHRRDRLAPQAAGFVMITPSRAGSGGRSWKRIAPNVPILLQVYERVSDEDELAAAIAQWPDHAVALHRDVPRVCLRSSGTTFERAAPHAEAPAPPAFWKLGSMTCRGPARCA